MEHGAGGSEVAPRSPFVPTVWSLPGHGVGQTLPKQAQGTCRGYWDEVLGTVDGVGTERGSWCCRACLAHGGDGKR